MSPVNPHRPFTPDPELDSLRPARTGNQINGLNEAEILWTCKTMLLRRPGIQKCLVRFVHDRPT